MDLVSVCKSMKRRWQMRRGYQGYKVTYCRRRMRMVRLGAAGSSNEGKRQQQWAIQARLKQKLMRIPSPTKMLAWLRDAYVDAMLGMERSTSYFHSRVEVAGLDRKRIPRRRAANGWISGVALEHRVILETCNSLDQGSHQALCPLVLIKVLW